MTKDALTKTCVARIGIAFLDAMEIHRLGLRALFSGLPEYRVLGEAASCEEGCELFRRLHPDILIVDIRAPGKGSIDVLGRILHDLPGTGVVVHTACDSPCLLEQSLRLGARGYVTKVNAAQVLVRAVSEAARGHLYVSQDMLEKQSQPGQFIEEARLKELSRREHEIFLLLARGLGVKQCADTLHRSNKTLSNYATSIKRKLGVHTQAELVRLATCLGVVDEWN